MPSAFATHQSAESVPVWFVTPQTLDDVLSGLPETARAWTKAAGYRGSAGSVLTLPGPDGALAGVLYGAPGEAPDGVLLPGSLPGLLPAGDYHFANADDWAEQAALAWALGAYGFDRYRSIDVAGPRLRIPVGVDGARISRIAEGTALARDLINTPANDMGPAELEAAIRALAARYGASIDVVTGEALIDANFPLVYAVGAAAIAARAPRLVDLEWGNADHPSVTLVGKGVCFDTGGLDIKPASAMLLMKKDMGGAANVLGLAHMIMDAGLPIHLRVIVPAVENAVSGAAFRPGDVYASRKGITVEIGNTDAEGRLVLADALALADERDPELIIDMATLTGAARVALGPDLSPVYTDDDRFAADLARAAAEQADPVWRMPLWPPYDTLLSSKIADVNHISSGPFAGSITAALFLKRFVERAAWVHFDIYGWTPKAKPGRPEGGAAQAIRALYALLERRYGN